MKKYTVLIFLASAILALAFAGCIIPRGNSAGYSLVLDQRIAQLSASDFPTPQAGPFDDTNDLKYIYIHGTAIEFPRTPEEIPNLREAYFNGYCAGVQEAIQLKGDVPLYYVAPTSDVHRANTLGAKVGIVAAVQVIRKMEKALEKEFKQYYRDRGQKAMFHESGRLFCLFDGAFTNQAGEERWTTSTLWDEEGNIEQRESDPDYGFEAPE